MDENITLPLCLSYTEGQRLKQFAPGRSRWPISDAKAYPFIA